MKKITAMILALVMVLALAAGAFAANVENGAQTPNDTGKYRVFVTDEAGNPVKGAAVQFCSDVACNLGKTNEDGIAEFDAPEGVYTVHMLKVPQGYEKNKVEVTTETTYTDIFFVLKAA